MDLSTFIVTVYCLIDDWYGTRRLRERGPAPRLHDTEVLTMELVGEWLGFDQARALYRYFRTHWAHYFPAIRQIHRTTFTRQAAKLWALKRELWQHLLEQISYDPALGVIDSIALPLCQLTRQTRLQQLSEYAAKGYDSSQKTTYRGLRLHAVICWPGVIVAFDVTPANISDIAGAERLLGGSGWVLGDRAYWSPRLFGRLRTHGLALLCPYHTREHEPFRFPDNLTRMRRRIETVLSQLTHQLHAKTTWARTQLTLTARWYRKIATHSLGVWFTQRLNLPPLRFSHIITDY